MVCRRFVGERLSYYKEGRDFLSSLKTAMERSILHCDMNSFYASVELRKFPELRGKPVAVCGSSDERHGIVLAKTIEAKNMGVVTGEVTWKALQKCPELVILPPHSDEYMQFSKMALRIYESYTDRVEPFGIDECWLDVSGTERLFGSAQSVADELRERIKSELGLSISVGISFNKVFAKLGSDYKKPDASTLISTENFKEIVWPLKASAMIGVGRSTYAKLLKYGIVSLGDLARADEEFLRAILGVNGAILKRNAAGLDFSPVAISGYRPPIKSVGNGSTSRRNLKNNLDVKLFLEDLCYSVSSRLRRYELYAGALQLSIRNEDLVTKQVQAPLDYPTQNSFIIKKLAFELFVSNYSWNRQVRSLSIRAIKLSAAGVGRQILFTQVLPEVKKMDRLDTCLFQIREKFGKESMKWAFALGSDLMSDEKSRIDALPGSNPIL